MAARSRHPVQRSASSRALASDRFLPAGRADRGAQGALSGRQPEAERSACTQQVLTMERLRRPRTAHRVQLRAGPQHAADTAHSAHTVVA